MANTGNVFIDVLAHRSWLDVGGDRNITYYFDETSPERRWTTFEKVIWRRRAAGVGQRCEYHHPGGFLACGRRHHRNVVEQHDPHDPFRTVSQWQSLDSRSLSSARGRRFSGNVQ